MTALAADVASRVSTDAARHFVDAYYPALNSHRHQLASFYAPAASMPDGKALPIITWNGNEVPDPQALQKLFEEQMPRSHYDVQSYDCHVLNPNFVADAARAANPASGKNMTVLVSVSGYVKYGDSRSVSPKCFSDTFILVPNINAHGAKGRHLKEWLIQSQTFRIVV